MAIFPEMATANEIPQTDKEPDYEKLDFSFNWNNKLDCRAYTTLRLANPRKYVIGKRFAVYLNKKFIHVAEIMDVKTLTLDQINEYIARLDTGYSAEKCREIIRKMYAGKPINWEAQRLNFVLYRKFDPSKAEQD